MRTFLTIAMALLLVGCGKHPAQQNIEDAFAEKDRQFQQDTQHLPKPCP